MELQSETILDLKAFNRLFGEYQQRFIRFAGTYVSDAATAEDIVMESFMAAWEKRRHAFRLRLPSLRAHDRQEQMPEPSAFAGRPPACRRGYPLPRCAHAPNPHLDPRSLQPEELFSEEARRLVNETLDRLPEKTRAIFIRSRFDGKSYKEIAAEMGVTVKSVEFEVSKAMKILRVVLKDYLAYFIFWFYIN